MNDEKIHSLKHGARVRVEVERGTADGTLDNDPYRDDAGNWLVDVVWFDTGCCTEGVSIHRVSEI